MNMSVLLCSVGWHRWHYYSYWGVPSRRCTRQGCEVRHEL